MDWDSYEFGWRDGFGDIPVGRPAFLKSVPEPRGPQDAMDAPGRVKWYMSEIGALTRLMDRKTGTATDEEWEAYSKRWDELYEGLISAIREVRTGA